jgi:uncharacterized protein (TIGR03435 family)
MTRIIVCILLTWANGAVLAQSDPRPQFEVASVKTASADEQAAGGQGVRRPTGRIRTPDPSLFLCDSCTLADLVMSAFHIQPYQLSAPGWMETERFTVNARIPRGTTSEQLRLMQQRLLEERFRLTYHRQQKEMARCELVNAKGGARLKASTGEPTAADGREPGASITPEGLVSARYSNTSMSELALILSKQVHMPVIDATALPGRFDFDLTWVMDPEASPTIFEALQPLGLKLEQKKGLVDRVVIDHAEKVPTVN